MRADGVRFLQSGEAFMLRRFVRLTLALVPGCGPAVGGAQPDEAECPPADAEDLYQWPPLRVRLINETSEALVIRDRTHGPSMRYFDVEGVADGRSIHAPIEHCPRDPPSCADLMIDNVVDCEGIAFGSPLVLLPPATAYDTEWTVELLAEHELGPDCSYDGMTHACSVLLGATSADYSVRATSLLTDTCEGLDRTCDEVQSDGACRLRDQFQNPTCLEGPQASTRWDGASDITLVFDAN